MRTVITNLKNRSDNRTSRRLILSNRTRSMWLCLVESFIIIIINLIYFYFTHTYCRWHSGQHEALGINRTETNRTDPTLRTKKRNELALGVFFIVHYWWIPDGNWQRIFAKLEDHSTPWNPNILPNNKQTTPPLPTTPTWKFERKCHRTYMLFCLGEEATLCRIHFPI